VVSAKKEETRRKRLDRLIDVSTNTKLREVAIQVLPAELAEDRERLGAVIARGNIEVPSEVLW
jgi:hypothetical protein